MHTARNIACLTHVSLGNRPDGNEMRLDGEVSSWELCESGVSQCAALHVKLGMLCEVATQDTEAHILLEAAQIEVAHVMREVLDKKFKSEQEMMDELETVQAQTELRMRCPMMHEYYGARRELLRLYYQHCDAKTISFVDWVLVSAGTKSIPFPFPGLYTNLIQELMREEKFVVSLFWAIQCNRLTTVHAAGLVVISLGDDDSLRLISTGSRNGNASHLGRLARKKLALLLVK